MHFKKIKIVKNLIKNPKNRGDFNDDFQRNLKKFTAAKKNI